jgi:hypothetical protein
MTHHFDFPFEVLLDPFFTGACVALIYPQMFQTRKLFGRTVEHQWYGRPVLTIGSMHLGSQYQTERIHQQMVLSSAEFLGSYSMPRTPPTLVVFTDWVSRMPALGWQLRPPRTRILSRKTALIFSQVPSKRHILK